jgi:hypothetical protein
MTRPSALAMMATFVVPSAVIAADFNVPSGTTATPTQFVSDPATEIAASVEGGYDTAATLSAKARIGFVRRF